MFGATGATGHRLVAQALQRGHEITAIVRDPARLEVAPQARLTVTTLADLTDVEAVAAHVSGHDAVLSTLGARTQRQARTTPVAGPATSAITAAMRVTGTTRLIALSAAPVGPPSEEESRLTRTVVLPLVRFAYRHSYADLRAMEDLLSTSDLAWTVIRPPMLTDAPGAGRYRAAIGDNVGGGSSITRSDLATAMLDMLEEPETIRRVVGVAS